MIKVHNLALDYLEYINRIKTTKDEYNEEIYKTICYKKNPEVYDHISGLFSHIDTSTALYKAVFEMYDMDEIKRKIISISERINERFDEIIESCKNNNITISSELEFNIYLLVGNASTNAIVTSFKRQSLFLFVESLAEGESFDVLLAHEILHIVQRTTPSCQIDKPVLKDIMFFEGLACSVSEIIRPELSLTEYLYVTESSEIENRKKFILDNVKMIKNDFMIDDWDTIRNYSSYGNFDVHRIAYDIGYYTVKEMLKNKTVDELLETCVEDNRKEFDKAFLNFVNKLS